MFGLPDILSTLLSSEPSEDKGLSSLPYSRVHSWACSSFSISILSMICVGVYKNGTRDRRGADHIDGAPPSVARRAVVGMRLSASLLLCPPL